MKIKLTLEILENAEPDSVIFKGEIEDSPKGFYINGTDKMLKWVAVRGGGCPDWCIYAEDCYIDMSWDEVRTNGHKIMIENAKKVIDAPAEVWERWRS